MQAGGGWTCGGERGSERIGRVSERGRNSKGGVVYIYILVCRGRNGCMCVKEGREGGQIDV